MKRTWTLVAALAALLTGGTIMTRTSADSISGAQGGVRLATLTPQARAETEGGAEAGAIKPFRVHFSDEALTDLKRRVLATRWAEQETVADQSQGLPLAMIRELARYWATDYDWRKAEAKLNVLPQFVTTIDGLDNVTLYWLTNTAISSPQLYWDTTNKLQYAP